MIFPEPFRKNILEAFQEKGAVWLERLPELIQQYSERWSLRVLEPFELSFSYCAPALRANGQPVVFKLTVPNPDFTHQVHALRFFNGRGMVRMLDADIDQGALLMERLLPGKMLSEVVTDDEQATRIAAQVMTNLWVTAPEEQSFMSAAGWVEDFRAIRVKYAGRACPLPERTIERTFALYNDLSASAGPLFLLHGDLHHFNILTVAEEGGGLGWRAIDPFGVVGERELEIGGFIRNPYLKPPIDSKMERMLHRRLDIFQEMLGLDRQRMAGWCAVYAAVSAWWTLSGDGDGWQLDAALADFFGEMAG